MKLVPSELVNKYDLPEYADEWKWDNLPQEVRQEITDRMAGKETDYQKAEKEQKANRSVSKKATADYEKAKKDFDAMDKTSLSPGELSDFEKSLEELKIKANGNTETDSRR